MDIWLWISGLPNSPDWASSTSPFVYELTSSNPSHGEPQKIELRAEKMSPRSGSDTAKWVTFSIHVEGFESHTQQKTLWISDTCPLLSEKPFLPLVLQLLQEIVDRSPGSANASICPRSQLQKLKPDSLSWVLETHTPESFSGFFALIFLTRLFWLCAFDAPSQVGSLYFKSFLEPNLHLVARANHAPVVKAFLLRSGTDVELCLARAVGYILAKCLILKEMQVGPPLAVPPPCNLGLCYAAEAHGMSVLKSYAPVSAMKPTRPNPKKNAYPLLVEAKECALRYTLAHQQLESVVQLEYTVRFCEDHIQVSTRVDNLRFHVARLGYNNNNDDDVGYGDEMYFPSRVRFWVGPEVGSSYVTSLSLGKSTENVEKEVETQKIVKGNFGNVKIPKVKATSRTSMRATARSWRWDQDAEGNAAVYDGILHDAGGAEVYAATEAAAVGRDGEMRGRYAGGDRVFTKGRGLAVAGDECGAEVRWRVGKEMEGSVLKWRIGSEVWMSYRPVSETTSYWETRCMEWCDEVDLHLVATN